MTPRGSPNPVTDLTVLSSGPAGIVFPFLTALPIIENSIAAITELFYELMAV